MGTPLYTAIWLCVIPKGIEFAHFSLESAMVFERPTGGRNVYVFAVSIPKWERKSNMQVRSKWILISFSWRSNLSNE